MNLLLFSDKDPIGFQSRRQLGWLFEFIKDNHKEINVKMLDSFDDSKTNYDAVLIHGYDAKTIKHLRKTHPSSKLLLLNPGLLTTYHEISLISKQKIKAILQKNIIEKNIDAILVRSVPWSKVVKQNTTIPVFEWMDFEKSVDPIPKNRITNNPVVIGYHGNPYHLMNKFSINGAPALEMLNEDYDFVFHVLSNNTSTIEENFNFKFPIKYFEYDSVDFNSVLKNFDIGVTPTMSNEDSINETNVYIRNANRTLTLLSKGIPSVTSPLPQSKIDLVEGIHTLFAVTTQQWYESLKKYIEDQNLYKKISENGYKLVKENFCVDQASIKLIEILREVVSGSKT